MKKILFIYILFFSYNLLKKLKREFNSIEKNFFKFKIDELDVNISKLFFRVKILGTFTLILLYPFNLYAQKENYVLGIVTSKYNYVKINNAKKQVIKIFSSLERKYNSSMNISFYDKGDEALDDFFINNKLDLLLVWSLDYLKNKEIFHKNVKKIILLKHSQKDYFQYNLLVRKDSKINSIGDLRDKTMSSFLSQDNARIWFDSIILEKYKTIYKKFIKEEKIAQKNTTSILDVYFGKKDFCIVSSIVYKDMLELNPSLLNELKIVKTSPNIFMYAIVAIHKNAPAAMMDKMDEILVNEKSKGVLDKTLKIVGIDDFKYIEFEYLKELDNFYDNYLELKRKYD